MEGGSQLRIVVGFHSFLTTCDPIAMQIFKGMTNIGGWIIDKVEHNRRISGCDGEVL